MSGKQNILKSGEISLKDKVYYFIEKVINNNKEKTYSDGFTLNGRQLSHKNNDR
jgi:hypothetical protein